MNRYHASIILISVILFFPQQGNTQYLRNSPEMLVDVQTTLNQYAVAETNSLIQSLIDQTNLDTLIHFVNILSGEDSITVNDSTYLFLSRNALHSHNDLAANYIFQTLDRFGLPTFNQNYTSAGRNVYSVQTGTDSSDQKFVICAHYDDMPWQPPAPGADDNASGTAVVLEAARIFSQIQTPYTIIFALWDEEEVGAFGSNYFAQQSFQSEENICGVINVDMISWDGNDDGLFEIHTQPVAKSPELADLIVDLENHYSIGLSPVVCNPGTRNSDHHAFWNRGYSAVLLIEVYWGADSNPYFHTSQDKIKHFNLDYFHAMSKLAVASIAHLAFYNITPVPDGLEKSRSTYLLDFELKQNYPNPFNPITNIEFALPHSGFVSLKIYNMLGEEVATLVSKKLAAGKYKYDWDASGWASGIYFYRIETDNFSSSKKCLLLK